MVTRGDFWKSMGYQSGGEVVNSSPFTVENLNHALKELGIENLKERAGILAQIQGESSFKPRSETLDYSAERLYDKYRKYFPTLEEAKKVGRTSTTKANQEAIANILYDDANRSKDYKLGNTKPGDGWKYRGRGLIQITGKDNYKKYGDRIGVDLVSNPDLANEPENAIKIAVEYMKDRSKNLSSAYDNTKGVGPDKWEDLVEERRKYQREIFDKLGGIEAEWDPMTAEGLTAPPRKSSQELLRPVSQTKYRSQEVVPASTVMPDKGDFYKMFTKSNFPLGEFLK